MRRLFIPLVILLVIVFVVIGCAQQTTTTAPATTAPAVTTTSPAATKPATSTTPAAKPTKDTITIANADFGNETFDQNDVSVWCWYITDRLVTQDLSGKVVPDIAEKFEFDPNTGIWTFHIRQGVKFHNGDPLTADDVKFSIDRFGDTSVSKNPWSPYISAKYNKKEVKIIDANTVQFIPDHPELQQGIVFAQVMIYPKKYFESVGHDGFNKAPIGTGPWKFVSLVSKTQLTLQANTDYWGQKPAFKSVIEKMVPEQSTRVAMLKSGDADIIFPQTGIDWDRIAELQGQGFRVVNLGLPSAYTLAFQATWLPGAGPTGDIRVRQAMSYALNRPEIGQTWYHGYAKPGGMFFMLQSGKGTPQGFGYSDDLLPTPYDLAKAKSLLADAGYPSKFADPTIHIFAPPVQQDFMQVLIGYWQAAGLQVKLEVVDMSVYYGMLFARPKEGDKNVGWLWPWTSVGVMNATYHSANMYTTWGVHGTSNDAKATQMYNDYLKITDPVKSEQAWSDFQKYVKTLWIDFGIMQIDPVYAVGPALGEFTGANWMSNQDAINGVQQPK
jgi:peptide/nickel transport system substrate-binding protein